MKPKSTAIILGAAFICALLPFAGCTTATHQPGGATPVFSPGTGLGFFSDAVVNITVTRSNKIKIEPEEAVIIFYDPLGRDPRKARQVRWVVTCQKGLVMEFAKGEEPRCLEGDETLVIRAKADQNPATRSLFRSPQASPRALRGGLRNEFAIPGSYNTVASGLPLGPRFGDKVSLSWKYDIELWRDGELVYTLDPEVWIEKDN